MSEFQGTLAVEVLADGERYRLLLDLLYKSSKYREDILVPEGYVTDFASVPRVFWTFFPPSSDYTKAAVVHDYLCDKAKLSEHNIIERRKADDIFLEAMEVLGVSWWKRYIIWSSVRLYAGLFVW